MERRIINVYFHSWAGLTAVPAEIRCETPRQYTVQLLRDFPLRNWKQGDIVKVPKTACMSVTAPASDGEQEGAGDV